MNVIANLITQEVVNKAVIFLTGWVPVLRVLVAVKGGSLWCASRSECVEAMVGCDSVP